jgi:hypothetical protein
MKIAVLACDALKDEIERFIADDPDIVSKEYLEFGLHLTPDKLRQSLMERITALDGRADALFLGYAHCQALKGLPDQIKLPTVMLDTEDCISALLTTEVYHMEKNNGGITWFLPTGWAKYGSEGMIKLFKLDEMSALGYTPDYFLKIMFNGFSRCLYIDTGAGDVGSAEEYSRELAERLSLRHERMTGSLSMIEEAIARTKELARAAKRPCPAATLI